VKRRQPFKRLERRLAGTRRPITDEITSLRMGRIGQRGTKPELLVRSQCRAMGLYYTTLNRDLPGSPDLANRSKHWAIFVHGCFWHRHVRCRRASTPKRNTAFWLAKFAHNVARDALAEHALKRLGYRVLVVWACEAEEANRLRTKLNRFSRQSKGI
jgi:DNA mismatch endonuclease, patch repair protein